MSMKQAEPTDEQLRAAIVEYRLRKGSAMTTDDFVAVFRTVLGRLGQQTEPAEDRRTCENCCGSGKVKHDDFNPTQSNCPHCDGEGSK